MKKVKVMKINNKVIMALSMFSNMGLELNEILKAAKKDKEIGKALKESGVTADMIEGSVTEELSLNLDQVLAIEDEAHDIVGCPGYRGFYIYLSGQEEPWCLEETCLNSVKESWYGN